MSPTLCAKVSDLPPDPAQKSNTYESAVESLSISQKNVECEYLLARFGIYHECYNLTGLVLDLKHALLDDDQFTMANGIRTLNSVVSCSDCTGFHTKVMPNGERSHALT